MIGVAAACAVVSTVFTVGAVGYYAEPPVIARTNASEPRLSRSGGTIPKGAEREGVVQKPEAIVRKKPTVVLAQAQTSPAPAAANSLWGTVVDPSNAVVPNALLTLVGSDNQVAGTATTNAIGAYSFLNISPGTYSLNVKMPGFKSQTRTNIQIAPGEAHNGGTMVLMLGAVFESMTVGGSRSAPVYSPGPVGPAVPAPAPAGSAPLPPTPPGAFRVGGNVQAARLINAVKPAYPTDLQQQGVQGTVKIEGVISKEGVLSDFLVVPGSTDSRLMQAALDAVKQWRFQPTLLNGQPVEVMDTIDINYQLNN
jgi:TonB family protein